MTTTLVFIPGAGGAPWTWHLVEPELRKRGYEVVAVDLPTDDDSAGLAEYADAVVDAIGDRSDVVLVAHSLGGFTAPLVCARVPVRLMVFVTAMIPRPGEAPGDWWANTGFNEVWNAETERNGGEDDPVATYMHDVPAELVAESQKHDRNQSGTPMEKPWPLAAWPDVPTKFLLCTEDRFFPAEFMRRVVKDRLNIVPDEIATSHMPMLAKPIELVDHLVSYIT